MSNTPAAPPHLIAKYLKEQAQQDCKDGGYSDDFLAGFAFGLEIMLHIYTRNATQQ